MIRVARYLSPVSSIPRISLFNTPSNTLTLVHTPARALATSPYKRMSADPTINPQDIESAKQHVVTALKNVHDAISSLTNQLQLKKEPRLVAVSKIKPSFLVKAAYDAGQRHFGENYIQELATKAEELSDLEGIKWHFIGHLQSNKCKQLLGVPHLYMIETVDSQKLASILNKTWEGLHPLNIMVQINTSGEESKSGIEPSDVSDLVEYVLKECPKLHFSGLMTIGRPAPSPDQPDFKLMVELRKHVCEKFGLSLDDVELSMGMSSDYKVAIEMGSTNVRIGSVIFGERDYSK